MYFFGAKITRAGSSIPGAAKTVMFVPGNTNELGALTPAALLTCAKVPITDAPVLINAPTNAW